MFQWWTPIGRAILRARGEQAAKAKRLLMAVVRCLSCEGWEVSEIGGQRLRIRGNGQIYERSADWLTECDFSSLPPSLANDLTDIVRNEGFCNG